jgi:ABC-type amino acid transport substrate-binding protein
MAVLEVVARTRLKPLLQKLKNGRAAALLNDLRALAKRLRQKKRQAVAAEVTYLEDHQGRVD